VVAATIGQRGIISWADFRLIPIAVYNWRNISHSGTAMADYHLIQAQLHAHLHEYLDIHRQMVEINSFTANPQGINVLGDLTARLFSSLGFQSEYVQSANPQYGRHVFMHRAGEASGGSKTALALVSHLDTVFPPEEEQQNDFHWRVQGDRIYGPGTVDIKGGTVMIYMVLDAIRHFAP
jgi:glutamate carboxypeptidase